MDRIYKLKNKTEIIKIGLKLKYYKITKKTLLHIENLGSIEHHSKMMS